MLKLIKTFRIKKKLTLIGNTKQQKNLLSLKIKQI